jgi:hypothetical protein
MPLILLKELCICRILFLLIRFDESNAGCKFSIMATRGEIKIQAFGRALSFWKPSFLHAPFSLSMHFCFEKGIVSCLLKDISLQLFLETSIS